MRILISSRYVLATLATLTVLIASLSGFAYAQTPTQFESHAITGNDLKNNPFVAKILSEIEFSKKQVAQLEQDQKNRDANEQLIAQQRAIAKQLEDQALQMLQAQAETNSSQNAYERFVTTVPNNNTKQVFMGEFNFMQKRVDAGHLAMKQVLANGGTWEEAMQAFSQYAGIKRTEMISVNNDLNIQYGLADPTVQAAFNQNGLLPDDYIKVPNQVMSHGGS
jgi:alanyl-tRNA synthetase